MSAPLVLLTGATGYIASHTWVALVEAGYRVVGVDDFSNSSPEVLRRLAELTGQEPVFTQANVCDAAAMEALFASHDVSAAVHFAAFKAVGESAQKPLDYYANNLGGLVTLCQTMQRHGVRHLVFSSSATVYGKPEQLPIPEDAPLSATNPYGSTKLMGETILGDLEKSDPSWKVALLRYFNPAGAHPSGRIGEDPRGIPNNIMPFITQVAVGKRPKLMIFGNDYDTPDGTGVRDYIHVMDLAEGHVSALRYLLESNQGIVANLGTGRGYSVLELVHAFEQASARPIPYEITARRPGDIDASYADPSRAHRLLHWHATRDLAAMCEDSWRWQRMNPHGFEAS